MKANDLIKIITEAFDGVERGDGVSLREAEAIDDWLSRDKQAEARSLDKDSRWQDVPDADISLYYWLWSFFDHKAFRYYLPAYIIWSIKNHPSDISDSSERLISELNPLWPDNSRFQQNILRFNTLSRNEMAAVCNFIRYMHEEHGEFQDKRVLSAWELLAVGKTPDEPLPSRVIYL